VTSFDDDEGEPPDNDVLCSMISFDSALLRLFSSFCVLSVPGDLTGFSVTDFPWMFSVQVSG